ncbi:hypothetical protein [Arthrobacter subterraneus]|uniref:hypothetical protein n=1 Tax=Arthrobacter subterraneus TaxID=335973 RepID=UPI003814BAF3
MMNDDALVQQLRNTPEETALVWLLPYQDERAGNSDEPQLDDHQRVEVERNLIRHELIDPELDLTHTWYLTPRGRRVAEKLIISRTRGPGRRAAVEKALMRFIDDEEPQVLNSFLNEVVDGTPVTERELERAFEALEEFRLAKAGLKSWGGGIHQPTLTPSGRAAVDDPRDPIDFVRQGGVVNYDNRNHVENHGTIGVAAAGDHAVQSGNKFQSQSVADVATVLAELQRELDTIGDVPAPAVEAVQAMSAEAAASEPDRGKLSALSAAFTGAIASKFGEDAYQAIPVLIARLGTLIANLT